MASQEPLKPSSKDDEIPIKDRHHSHSSEEIDPDQQRFDYQRQSIRRATLTSHKMSPDVDKIYDLLKKDEDATYEQKIKTLREMHQSLPIKLKVKAMLDADLQRKHHEESLEIFSRFKLQTQSVWNKFLYQSKNAFYYLEPWASSIKNIQGQFGSGVASYFIFLRWLVYLNIVNVVLLLFFLLLPQLLYDIPEYSVSNSTSNSTRHSPKFTAYDLLTGSGWLSNSSLYFGHYTNRVINPVPFLYYNMPLAYLLVIAVLSVFNLLVVSYCLTTSYQRTFIDTAEDVQRKFSFLLFSAWDYSIADKEPAKLRKKAFCLELKELLFAVRKDQRIKTFKDKLIQAILMIVINVFCLAIMVGTSYLIYYMLDGKLLEIEVKFLEEMKLTLFVTMVSTSSYFILRLCTRLEFYLSRKMKLYLTMIRAVILKIVMIGMIVYFWTLSNSNKEQKSCLESELGQEIYRLILVNFLVALVLFTLLNEFVRKLLSKYVTPKIKPPHFSVGFNTLDLIYFQTLVWIGTFCMPLAPLINLIILVLLFYIKRYSVSKTCRPPKRTWSVNEAQTFYLIILFFILLISSLTVGFVLFSMEPSTCGPFNGFHNTGDVVYYLLFEKGQEHDTYEVVKYLTSPGVLFTYCCALCVSVYYARAQAKAQINSNKLLKEQLIQVQKDKVFLLGIFQDALSLAAGSEDKAEEDS